MKIVSQVRRSTWYILVTLISSIAFTELLHANDVQQHQQVKADQSDWQCTLKQEQQNSGLVSYLADVDRSAKVKCATQH